MLMEPAYEAVPLLLVPTPRCTWNPDVDSPIKYKDGWVRVPDQGIYDNAFKIEWELFLRHVVKDEPFPWTLLEGARGVVTSRALIGYSRKLWTLLR